MGGSVTSTTRYRTSRHCLGIPAGSGSSTLTGGTSLLRCRPSTVTYAVIASDDGGGSRLRDFIHYCNVEEWDRELDLVETLSVGVSVQYRFRLPKIDRSNPDDVRPHASKERPHVGFQ